MEKAMAIADIGLVKYGKLLAKALPKVIETREEFHHYVEMMERLDRRAERGETLTPEENALLALLEQLVKEYDDKIDLPYSPPYRTVPYLMERQGLRQVDLLPVFGSRSVASEVLNGKREIGTTHARKLAEFFHLPVRLFI
jgi:antitoxin component HigA of HigAB toxin-antitoxin module